MIKGAYVILLLAVTCVPALSGQDPRVQEQTAPPPLKIITRQERSQLNESKDPKARLKTTIELAETHLANAENHTSQREYDNAAAEAGMYWALVEDAFSYMKTIDRDNNRRRDLYKRLELALRAQGPRLSTMRRSTPVEYSVWIKEIEDFARKGRTEALNSFYGNTVIHDAPQIPVDAKQSKKSPQEN
jgi:hypothetical protein